MKGGNALVHCFCSISYVFPLFSKSAGCNLFGIKAY
jgi:hypothetical protein